MPVTQMGGQYFYNGQPYRTLQEAKMAEAQDMRSGYAVPDVPKFDDSAYLKSIGDKYAGNILPDISQPKQYSGRGNVGMPMPNKQPTQAPVQSPMNTQNAAPTQQPKQDRGMLGGLLDYIGSDKGKDMALALAAGLSGMSHRPNQMLQQAAYKELGDRKATRKSEEVKNRTVEELRKMGREDLANAVMSGMLPASEAAKYIFKLKSGSSTPAELQTFEAMTEGMTPEQKEQARRIALGLDPRAASSLSISPELLAERAYMTQGGKGTAEAEIDSAKSNAARDAGMRMFEYGLSNLEESLAGTTTGAFAGLMPAITGSQQMADQAVAMMAPLLKQTFRAAGEGVFTDKDQELLLAMLPTRGTSSEVAARAIQNIRMLVEFKLQSGSDVSVEDMRSRFGLSPSEQPQPQPQPQQPAQTGGFKIKTVR